MPEVVFVDIPLLKTTLPQRLAKALRQSLMAGDMLYHKRFPETQLPQVKRQFSRGLLTVATALHERGISVLYLNFSEGIDVPAIIEATSNCRYVAFSAMTPTVPVIASLCQKIKKVNKGAVTVVGGPHATFADVDLVENGAADIVVRGSGEETLQEIVGSYPRIDKIAGITYPARDGSDVVRNADRTSMSYIPAIQPLYTLLPGKIGEYKVNLFSSMGCASRCTFCLDWKMRPKPQFRGVDDVVTELSYLKSVLAPGDIIQFFDSDISAYPDFLHRLCDALRKEDLPFRYVCDIAPGTLNPGLVKDMAACGFVGIKLGFDSDDDGIHKLLHKTAGFDTYVKTAGLIHDHSEILVTAYWLSNLPGTTAAGLSRSKQIIQQLLSDQVIDLLSHKIFVPYPGTAVYSQPAAFHGTIKSRDWSRFDRLVPDPVFINDGLAEYDWLHYMIGIEEMATQSYLSRLRISPDALPALPGPSSYKRCYLG